MRPCTARSISRRSREEISELEQVGSEIRACQLGEGANGRSQLSQSSSPLGLEITNPEGVDSPKNGSVFSGPKECPKLFKKS